MIIGWIIVHSRAHVAQLWLRPAALSLDFTTRAYIVYHQNSVILIILTVELICYRSRMNLVLILRTHIEPSMQHVLSSIRVLFQASIKIIYSNSKSVLR